MADGRRVHVMSNMACHNHMSAQSGKLGIVRELWRECDFKTMAATWTNTGGVDETTQLAIAGETW